MQQFHKRVGVIGGFGVLLAVLVISTALTRRQLSVQDSNQGWVAHTQDVMLEINTLESLLKDAETGQRGYLYTGEARYLEPYNSAITEIPAHIDRLAGLTADNPQQQARIATLRRLIKEKRDELGETLALYDENKKAEARALVLTDRGKSIMDQIRSTTAEMRREESSLEASRLREVEHSTRILVLTLYLTTGLAVIGLASLAFYILRAMAEREKHAAQMREREQWFRVTLGSIGDAVIATDEHGIVTFLNNVAEEIIGIPFSRMRGQAIEQVFPIFNEQSGLPVENPVAKVMTLGRIIGLANHTVLKRADGKIIPIEDSAAPIYDDQRKLRGVVMVFRDVTAERNSQEVLRKTEKLAAAGRLAATVAHEINNPLEAVGNLVYLSRRAPDVPEKVQGFLALAEQELERVSHIARQTLGFYRDTAEPSELQMRTIIDSVISLYENKLRSKDIKIEIEALKCGPVRGLQGELRQLVGNLLSNAADAVQSGGRIKIMVKPCSLPNGEGVELSVADNGPGIPAENQARIFEPFFTTKDVGTGLGLWVSKGIAERHGGTLTLTAGTDPGYSGALFTVFLPSARNKQMTEGASAGEQ